MVKKLLEHFMKKIAKSKSKRIYDWKSHLEKSQISNGKDIIIYLIVGLIKRMLCKNELIFS